MTKHFHAMEGEAELRKVYSEARSNGIGEYVRRVKIQMQVKGRVQFPVVAGARGLADVAEGGFYRKLGGC